MADLARNLIICCKDPRLPVCVNQLVGWLSLEKQEFLNIRQDFVTIHNRNDPSPIMVCCCGGIVITDV